MFFRQRAPSRARKQFRQPWFECCAPRLPLSQVTPFPAEIAEANEDVVARFRLEVTDLAGDPIDHLETDQQFLLNVYVSDTRQGPTGVFSAYLDIHFDATQLEPVGSARFGDHYVNAAFDGGTTPGILDEVGAFSNSFQPLGGGDFLLFQMSFLAQTEGLASFVAEPADTTPASLVLLYGEYQPVGVGQIQFDTLEMNVTPIGASPVVELVPATLGVTSTASNRNLALGSINEQFAWLHPILPEWIIERVGRTEARTADRTVSVTLLPQRAAWRHTEFEVSLGTDNSNGEGPEGSIELLIAPTFQLLPSRPARHVPGLVELPSTKVGPETERDLIFSISSSGFLRMTWYPSSLLPPELLMIDLAEVAYEEPEERGRALADLQDEALEEETLALDELATSRVTMEAIQGQEVNLVVGSLETDSTEDAEPLEQPPTPPATPSRPPRTAARKPDREDASPPR